MSVAAQHGIHFFGFLYSKVILLHAFKLCASNRPLLKATCALCYNSNKMGNWDIGARNGIAQI